MNFDPRDRSQVPAPVEFDLATAMKRMNAAVAEQNRLEKFEAKAEQRMLARKQDFLIAEAKRRTCLPGSPEELHWAQASNQAIQAWEAEADERLLIVSKICSVRQIIRRAESEIISLKFNGVGLPDSAPE